MQKTYGEKYLVIIYRVGNTYEEITMGKGDKFRLAKCWMEVSL